jgi:hypothetical protein
MPFNAADVIKVEPVSEAVTVDGYDILIFDPIGILNNDYI